MCFQETVKLKLIERERVCVCAEERWSKSARERDFVHVSAHSRERERLDYRERNDTHVKSAYVCVCVREIVSECARERLEE